MAARRSNVQPLTLDEPAAAGAPDASSSSNSNNTSNGHGNNHNTQNQYALESPKSPATPKSPRSPRSPFRFAAKKAQLDDDRPQMQSADAQSRALPPSLTTPALSNLQQRAGASATDEKGERGPSQQQPVRSGFFGNYKASKSSSRLQADNARPATEEGISKDDHPATTRKVSAQEPTRPDPPRDRSTTRRPVGAPPRTDVPTSASQSDQPRAYTSTSASTSASASANFAKRNKPKPFNLLSRTKSIRGDEQSPRDTSSPTTRYVDPERVYGQHNPIKTAPLRSENDRSFRDMMSSNVRQHSADRQPATTREEPRGRDIKDAGRTQTSFSTSFRDVGGHTFLTNLRNGATKGAGALSKGLFGKSARSGSTTEKEGVVDDEHYQLKVINKPLVEQTRLTRISKKLEDSRDKTEFWMPAFPWRAIDYLNYKGSDVEGLYRVPGSGPQIKRWQRRFDEELDIDLFEQEDLYDINIIGSMLKAWLRELPDELFPKESQDRISQECPNSETVPQILIDELSNLSPFKYYLLFAITCHLSLLLAHADKNKMDFRNLCICFQPCMKIDSYCFKFLVCDWRDCWKGCKTEAEYSEAEYKFFKESEQPPKSAEGQSSTAIESHDERNVSSSDSSKPSIASANEQSKVSNGQMNKKLPLSESNDSLSSINTTTLTLNNKEVSTPKKGTDMRPLSPILPLSPLGI